MRNVIFILSTVILALSMNACKTRSAESQKVSTTVENSSVGTIHAEKGVDPGLDGKYWKLIELIGNQVIAGEDSPKEAHIIFNADNRISGNAGCNNFAGSYQLSGADRITFSQVASTRMMCISGMDTEDKFLQVLNTADSFIIRNDTLTLNRARMAPLARFAAVYVK